MKVFAAKVRTGFTLIEILVVVGLIVLLISILIPALSGIHRKGMNTKAMAHLGMIRTGLETYFSKFHTYPDSTPPTAPSPYALQPGRGPAMLAQGLMGYMAFDVDGAGSKLFNGSQSPWPTDPVYGFRVQNPAMGGAISGPYASDDPNGYRKNTPGRDEAFVDPWGKEILYFRAVAPPVGMTMATNPVVFKNQPYDTNTSTVTAVFNSSDCPANSPAILAENGNTGFFKNLDVNSNTDGRNVKGKSGYLLISAGLDSVYFRSGDTARPEMNDDLTLDNR